MNMHERHIVDETVRAVLVGYRSGPWSNAEVADYLMKALDGKGLFKNPLAPVDQPTTTSETMSGSEAMSHISVEVDTDDEDSPYLYCVECGDGCGYVGGEFLSALIVKAAAHWKDQHS